MRVFMMGACFAALLGATLATHQAAAQSSGRAIAGGTRILRAAGRTPAALRSGTAHAGRNVVGGTRGVFSPGVVGPTRGAAGYGGQQYARSYRTWSGPAVGGQHYAATTGGGQPYATGYRGIDGPGMGSGAGYGQSGYRIPSDGRVHQLRFDAHGREFICVQGRRVYLDPPQGRPGGEGQWGHGPQQYQSGYGQYDQQGAYGQAYDGDMTPAPEIPADAGFDAADAPPAAPEAFRNDPSAGAAAGDARTTDETGTELDGAGAAARSSTQPRASSGAEAE